MPPMLEYLESLMPVGGHDMDLRMFKLVDQLSGRTLGLRADMTTQVARIDPVDQMASEIRLVGKSFTQAIMEIQAYSMPPMQLIARVRLTAVAEPASTEVRT